MSRMIDAGCTTPGAMVQRIQAASGREKQSSATKPLADLVGTSLRWAIPLGLALPPVAGYVGGNLLARATDVDEEDVDDFRKQEIINEYRRQTTKLLRKYPDVAGR